MPARADIIHYIVKYITRDSGSRISMCSRYEAEFKELKVVDFLSQMKKDGKILDVLKLIRWYLKY